jgi:hypothetical protein
MLHGHVYILFSYQTAHASSSSSIVTAIKPICSQGGHVVILYSKKLTSLKLNSWPSFQDRRFCGANDAPTLQGSMAIMLLLWIVRKSNVCRSSGLRWHNIRENLSTASKPEKQRARAQTHTHTHTVISYTYHFSLPEERVSK